MAPAVKSLGRLDGWIDQIIARSSRVGEKEENHLSPTIALYLYGRSFFLEGQAHRCAAPGGGRILPRPVAQVLAATADRQSQAHLAIALKRFGDKDNARRTSCGRSRSAG